MRHIGINNEESLFTVTRACTSGVLRRLNSDTVTGMQLQYTSRDRSGGKYIAYFMKEKTGLNGQTIHLL